MSRLKVLLRPVVTYTLIIYGSLIGFGIIADHYFQFRKSDTATEAWFAQHNESIHIGYYKSQGREIRYIFTDDQPGKPFILFIHGAPASSTYFKEYLADKQLRAAANLVAVDRPGYGYSGLGEPIADIGMQAAMIAPIIDSLHRLQRPVILVGASYGTAVASRIAMDYGSKVDGLVLLAPAIAPAQEKTYLISYVLETPLFSWAQPRMIHSANVEKFNHEAELRKMENRWSEIKVPVIYYQGAEDELIYTTNATFARTHITNCQSLSIKMLPGLGHVIAFKAKDEITVALNRMMGLAANYYASRRDDNEKLQASVSVAKKSTPSIQ